MKIQINLLRRLLLGTLVAGAAISLALPAQAEFVQGKQYTLLSSPKTTPVPTGKIAVIEFFSYHCPHCSDLNPIMSKWEKTLPADVVLVKVPIIWGKLQGLARAYYTLDMLGAHDVSDKAFNAYQRQRINLGDEKIFLDWAAQNGVDRAKAESMYKSFAVSSKVAQSERLEREYRVQDVPHVFVNGNIEMNLGGGFNSMEEFLKGVDDAIALARKSAKK